AASEVGEADGTAALTVTRTCEAELHTEIEYYTVDGVAEAGADYTAARGQLAFAPDETQQSVTVTLTDDELDEPRESFSLMLAAGDAGAVGDIPETTVTIVDDDVTEVSVRMAEEEVDEAGAAATVTVALGRALGAGEAIEVRFAFGGEAQYGEDYILEAPDSALDGVGYLNFESDGDEWPSLRFIGDEGAPDSATLLLSALSDGEDEDGKVRNGLPDPREKGWIGLEVVAEGTMIDGGASTGERADFTINDEVLPVPAISITGPEEIVEGENLVVTVTADMAAESDYNVYIFIQHSGDFLTRAEPEKWEIDTVIMAAGETELTHVIATVDDDVHEGDGWIAVTFSASEDDNYKSGEPSEIYVTIRDNDPPPPTITVSAGPDVTEGEDAVFTLHADGPVPADTTVTVDITADSAVLAEDEAPGQRSVVIAAGATDADFRIGTRDNETEGDNGSVDARVLSGEGYDLGSPDRAEVQVLDDEAQPMGTTVSQSKAKLVDKGPPEVELRTAMPRVVEGEDFVVAVHLSRPVDGDLRIPLTVARPNAGAGGDELGADLATARIAAGETAGEVRVPTVDDRLDAPDGRLGVALGALPDGILAGPVASLEVVLADNDDPPDAIALSVDPRIVREAADPTQVRIVAAVEGASRFAAPQTLRVSLGMAGDAAVAGEDYAPVPAFMVHIAAGADFGEGVFRLAVANDGADEGEEALTVAAALADHSGGEIQLSDLRPGASAQAADGGVKSFAADIQAGNSSAAAPSVGVRVVPATL
ncbi:MAG: hypothetical protein OXG51_10580, partial [Gammaproteobacteria bacterium]|nr:hypothetical protein [Gammaproteobacteria bacterium]